MAWTGCLTLLFGRIAAYNLGNYRPVTNDEVELMSVAYKLATQGVLGSDLFVGFFGADQHYLITLPLQHVLEAMTFRVFGPGVAEARWVSLVAGASIVWVVGWLAYRWYGLATAAICQLLLVAWPSNLTAAANGLPLFAIARIARYDVLAVAFTWFTIALLDGTLRRPRAVGGFALGICGGLAGLTTLTGTFVLPMVGLHWFWARGRTALADRTLYWIIAGAGLIALPWVVFTLRAPADLAGQLAVYGGRWDFVRPGFYWTNLLAEPSRYRELLSAALEPDSPSRAGSWVVAVGVWPAGAYIAWRSRRVHATGDRILLSSLVLFAALLALIDQTKTALYASILLPGMCMAVAAAWIGMLRWAWQRGRPSGVRLATGAASLGLVLTIGSEAVQAYHLSLTQAAAAGQYLGVGRAVERSLRPGARVLGPERWWWALHDHPYVSVRNLLFQWTASARVTDSPELVEWLTRANPDSVVVNDNVRGDVRDFPAPVQQQFWTFINVCTRRVAYLNDPTYLEIEVYEIMKPSPRPEVCGTPD